MIRGPSIDLRLAEPDDAAEFAEWLSDVDVSGEFERFDQASPAEMERAFGGDVRWYVIQSKDGRALGYANHGRAAGRLWIGYAVLPDARGRGVASEAATLLVDYLFLHEQAERVQAETHPDNAASVRVLEKAGFRLEGRLRRTVFGRGRWRDTLMYSVIREEWQRPRMLPAGA